MKRPVERTRIVCRACGWDGMGLLAWRASNIRERLPYHGSYIRCADCESLNLVPTPTADELRLAYEGVLTPPTGSIARRKGWRAALRELWPNPHEAPARPPSPGARLLDVGCGNGAKLAHFQRLGWQCYGADLSRTAIAAASERLPIERLFAGPTAEIPFAEKSFELIRADNVVEHLSSPLTEVSAMLRLLQPGGQLRIYVPHSDALTVRLFHQGSISSWVPYHLTLFSMKGIRELFQRAGLTSISVSQYTPTDWLSLTAEQVALVKGAPLRVAKIVKAVVQPLIRPVAIVAPMLRIGEELVAAAHAPSKP